MADNGPMSIDALRRLTAQPDWPLISGLGLAGLALVESLVYATFGNGSDGSLSIGEIWAVPIMLRLALVEELRRLSDRILSARLSREHARRWETLAAGDQHACALLDRGLRDRPGALRLVGVGLSGLSDYRQLSLEEG